MPVHNQVRPQIVTLPPQPQYYPDLGIPVLDTQEEIDRPYGMTASYEEPKFNPDMMVSDFPLDYLPQSGSEGYATAPDPLPMSYPGSRASGGPGLATVANTAAGAGAAAAEMLGLSFQDQPLATAPATLNPHHRGNDSSYFDDADYMQSSTPKPSMDQVSQPGYGRAVDYDEPEFGGTEFYHHQMQSIRGRSRHHGHPGHPSHGGNSGQASRPGYYRAGSGNGPLRPMTMNARIKKATSQPHHPLTPRPSERSFIPTPSESGSELSVYPDSSYDSVRRRAVYGATSEFDLYTGGGYNSVPRDDEWY